MTTNKIYQRFRSLYQEKSTRYFDSTTWAPDIMSDAVHEIATEVVQVNPTFFGTKVGNLGSPSGNGGYVVDAEEYDAPIDLLKIDSLYVKDLGGPPYARLVEVQPWQKQDVAGYESPSFQQLSPGGKGEPHWYYVRGPEPGNSPTKIGFVPIPSRNGSANGVEFLYHATRTDITTLADTELTALPTDWHFLVARYMCVLAATADGSASLTTYVGLYNSALERKLADAARGRGEGNEMIEVVDGGDW